VEEGKGEGGFTFALAAIYTSPRAGPPQAEQTGKIKPSEYGPRGRGGGR